MTLRARARWVTVVAAALAFIEPSASLAEEARWLVDASLGAARNAKSSLRIRQFGFPQIELDARYDTRATEFPLYYAVRAARWRRDRAWALDLVHHKIHLCEPPPEVQSFAVSHGYNLLTLQHLWKRGVLYGGVGAGVVIGHPENQVRGALNPAHDGIARSGYHLTGPSGALLGGIRFDLGTRASAGAELRLTGSRARLPVANGEALAPNVAFHLQVGVGVRI